MAQILFLPTDQAFLLLDSPGTPADLSAAIHSNRWQPPVEYLHWLSSHGLTPDSVRLTASVHKSLVIVTLRRKRKLHLPRPLPVEFSLTHRQRQVLQGLMDGLTTRQIAARLGIQPRTVTSHVSMLKKVFGTKTRAQMVSKAAISGILRVRQWKEGSG